MAAAPGLQALGETLGGARVCVAGCAHLYSGGAGEKEFYCVFRGDDAAHAEDGDGNGARCFIDHAEGDGLDGRTGETAGDVGEAGAAGFDINGHCEEGVGHAEGVSTGVGGDFGHLRDRCDVGRELDEEGTGGCGFCAVDEVLE